MTQDLHAEVMLREVGLVAGHSGSLKAGLLEMQDFLSGAGIAKDAYRFTDGPGLSRGTLVSPAAIAKLLPIAGLDGTLANRFQNHPEAQAIHAKTGSLSHAGDVGIRRYHALRSGGFFICGEQF